MQPRKLQIGVARFPYAGNGATSAEIPEIADFLVRMRLAISQDKRCEEKVWMFKKADTPITMVRNLACKRAKDDGVDVLLMVDSDNAPDLEVGSDPEAKRFWPTAFDFLCEHYDRGPCVIGAPYTGPPPDPVRGGEAVVYVFKWTTKSNLPTKRYPGLELVSREEAALRRGVAPVAAIATGVILLDMRLFDILPPPWFDYEWLDRPFNTRKASTEDVYFTRNCSLLKIPIYAAWDCWAGHAKPSMEGRPKLIGADEVAAPYREAVLRGINSDERLIELNAGKSAAEIVELFEAGQGWQGQTEESGLPVNENSKGVVSVGMTPPVEDHKFLESLVRKLADDYPHGPLSAIEVGSWVGESALAICRGFGEAGGSLVCVDTWEGSPGDVSGSIARQYGSAKLFARFWENVNTRSQGAVSAIVGRSVEVAAQYGGSADIINLDSDHRKEAVKDDIRAWLPKVKPGGILCGHDYGVPGFEGVKEAVDELLGPVEVTGAVWWKRIDACVEPRHDDD